ncbi:AfsA-related hotdog domain-containing protein [Streptomyces sp. NPDC005827]|uniref:AfsA-related hotdog domain-containing protein n=1 Tax=Streptomyces sp. NPDC005827 TaxID=3157070 RepID=UPI0033E94760
MTINDTMEPERVRERLTFDQTVPRAIAHRRAVGEVFITDSSPAGPDTFLLAWQIPRAHALWGDRLTAHHDPFATAEAARQGCFVIVHRHLGIALDLPFSLQRFEFRVTAGLEPYRDDRRWPLQGLLRYRIGHKEFRGGDLGSMRIDGEVEIDGTTAMTVSGDVVFLSRGDYEALRAFQRSRKPLADVPSWRSADPVAAARVGRRDQRNVVVGAPGATSFPAGLLRYPMVMDRGHPSYFDHDYDHVPGPFIVEGFRQAGLLAACGAGLLPSPVAALTGLRATFADFGEFEAPLEYVAEATPGAGGRADVRVGLHQFGTEIAEGRIELTPCP